MGPREYLLQARLQACPFRLTCRYLLWERTPVQRFHFARCSVITDFRGRALLLINSVVAASAEHKAKASRSTVRVLTMIPSHFPVFM